MVTTTLLIVPLPGVIVAEINVLQQFLDSRGGSRILHE